MKFKNILLILAITVMTMAFSSAAFADGEKIKIYKNGTQESFKGSDKVFTGNVKVDPLFLQPEAPTRTTAAYVTFEPGARTAWHTHPAGQTLVITSGKGFVQQEGFPKREVAQGDVVFFPKDIKHWHGASETTPLVHIAIQEVIDGSSVTWMEQVTDEQYKGK